MLIHRGDALISSPGRGEIARKTVFPSRGGREKMLRSLDETLTYYYYYLEGMFLRFLTIEFKYAYLNFLLIKESLR